MTPRERIQALIERFDRNKDAYHLPSYGEAEVRKEFVEPFFKALGWDVDNERGYAEPYKDVIHEASVRIEGAPKAPDYAFRIGGTPKFFVEAKKPSVNLKDGTYPAYQLRRYGWSGGLPLSILTDFEEFAVYDCTVEPRQADGPATARILYITYPNYSERWDEIASIFARDAILKGSFDRFAATAKSKRGTTTVDEVFLEEIESWRETLARNIALRNSTLSVRELNFAVQRIIDRLIFFRISEDRGIETYGQLRESAGRQHIYPELVKLFHHADQKYNSGLFHFRREPARAEQPDTLTPALEVDDTPLKSIIGKLYYPDSPYEFSVLPAEILGHVYERFLGSTIRLTDKHRARVEQKPEVRKAGGVYYTPTLIVDYIVQQTLGQKLRGKRPDDVEGLRVLDPACGSGHFLVHAYQCLLDWHLQWYVEEGQGIKKYQKRIRESATGSHVLTTTEKKRILLNNIFGVDIDSQAVEVTKLSLLLKVLEGETSETLEQQLRLFAERALPDLWANIKCGNSLIEPDFYEAEQLQILPEEELYRVNPFDWKREFEAICAEEKGFDIIIGNPPYILLEDEFRDNDQIAYFRGKYQAASYKIDTYHLFIEQSLKLAKPMGLVSMITPANLLTNNYLKELRRLLLKMTRIREIVVIEESVFEDASVDSAIWVLETGGVTSEPFPLRRVRINTGGKLKLTQESYVLPSPEDRHALFTGSGSPELAVLWKRIKEECGLTLGDVAYVNFGKQLRDQREHPDDKLKLPDDAPIPDGYRPCYTGGDISRYELTWSGLVCIDDPIARRGGTWDPKRQNARQKLLCRQVGKYPWFAIDKRGYQVLNRAFMINLKENGELDPYLLLGILNSALLRVLWLHKFYDQRQTFPKIKGTYLEELPVPNLDPRDDDRRDFVRGVTEGVKTILSLREQAREAKTDHSRQVLLRQVEAVDEKVEKLVCALYGVTEDERRRVMTDLSKLLEKTSGGAPGTDSTGDIGG